MEKIREEMDTYVAVFNMQEAERRQAKIDFCEKFSSEEYDEVIQPFIDNGIMSMFKVEPNEHTRWYAEHLAGLVNARYMNVPEVESYGTGKERAVKIIAEQIKMTRPVDVQMKAEDIACDLVDAIIEAVLEKMLSDEIENDMY